MTTPPPGTTSAPGALPPAVWTTDERSAAAVHRRLHGLLEAVRASDGTPAHGGLRFQLRCMLDQHYLDLRRIVGPAGDDPAEYSLVVLCEAFDGLARGARLDLIERRLDQHVATCPALGVSAQRDAPPDDPGDEQVDEQVDDTPVTPDDPEHFVNNTGDDDDPGAPSG